MSISAAAPTALPTGAEVNLVQATPHRNYQTPAGFDHPLSRNFFAIRAEGESRAGSGDVYLAKF
jgi:hypothetical protein